MKRNNPFHYSIGTRVRINPFMRMVKPKAGDNIIDIGCGLGYFTDMIAKAGAYSVGIDLDQDCIKYCTQNMEGNYRQADVNAIPFSDNSFNKAICSEVLEHTKDNGHTLEEIRRVLVNHGQLIISVPCSEGIYGSFFKKIGHSSVDSESREYHYHKGYTKQELNNLLHTHKFHPNGEYEYTLVNTTEIFMGLTKYAVKRLIGKKINSQANALEVEKTWLWKIYKTLFPLVMLLTFIDKPWHRQLKGHMLIVKAECQK